MCGGGGWAECKGRLHIYSGVANKRVVIYCKVARVLSFEVGAGSHRGVAGEKRTFKANFFMNTI